MSRPLIPLRSAVSRCLEILSPSAPITKTTCGRVNQAEASFSERRLYEVALALMVSEISSIQNISEMEARNQRRLQIGYNRAASLMERMEKEGVVGPANHAGKREILIGGR